MRDPRIDPSIKIKNNQLKLKQRELEIKTGKSTSTCANCGSLPILDFQVTKRNSKKGGWYTDRLCKPCRKVAPKGKPKKKFERTTPLPSKAMSKEEKAKKRNKKNKRDIQLLTEVAVRKALKAKGVRVQDITPEMIVDYRKTVLEKRAKKHSKKVMDGKKYRKAVQEILERNAKRFARFNGKNNNNKKY